MFVFNQILFSVCWVVIYFLKKKKNYFSYRDTDHLEIHSATPSRHLMWQRTQPQTLLLHPSLCPAFLPLSEKCWICANMISVDSMRGQHFWSHLLLQPRAGLMFVGRVGSGGAKGQCMAACFTQGNSQRLRLIHFR